MINGCFIGIDTSCYTTSISKVAGAAVIDDRRIMLEVPKGSRGLRQSEAVFNHLKNIKELFIGYKTEAVEAVGCSMKPRDMDESYMPVFVVGESFAQSWSKLLDVPLIPLTHQHGHIYSAFIGRSVKDGQFCALHVSGGTLDVLSLIIEGSIRGIERIGGSLDITCGQLIDRAGVAAGLEFPAGAQIEKMYRTGGSRFAVNVNGLDANLSGAETQALRALAAGEDIVNVLSGVIDTAAETIYRLTVNTEGADGVIFTGGVMANSIIRQRAEQACREINAECILTKKEYCSDNAAGIALGAEIIYKKGEF